MALELKIPKEDRGEVWFWTQVPLGVLYFVLGPTFPPHWRTDLRTFGFLMMGWGAMFFFGALVTVGRTHGWHNLTPFPKPLRGLTLITTGAFAYVRHPFSLGLLLMAFGHALYDQNIYQLLIACALTILFYFQSLKEETFLRNDYPPYVDYAAKVKRLIPGLL